MGEIDMLNNLKNLQLRLNSKADVRLFSVAITGLALAGNLLLLMVFLPMQVATQIFLPGSAIVIILAFPISYFVGRKILAVHRLSVRLQEASDHDILTGAATRVSFYKTVATDLHPPCAVIVTDIDYFKAINDSHGHQAGDVALKQFVATLMRNCREDDIVARFGGEEFVIVLRQAGVAQGLSAAHRLCQRVQEKPLNIDGTQVRLTASFGVTELLDVSKVDEAINRADMAVYRAKQSGRNQVCAFDPKLDIRTAPAAGAE